MLFTRGDIVAQDIDASQLRVFQHCIKNNYKSWSTFAEKLGRTVNLEELILVTGRHVTDHFFVCTFSDASRNEVVGLQIGHPESSSGSAAGHKDVASLDTNCGPITLQPNKSLLEGRPLEDNVENPTQCVFLRGYRVKEPRSSISMTAAASHHSSAAAGRVTEDDALRSDSGATNPSEDLSATSDMTPEDPTHPILKYILMNSYVPLAIVHDNDLARLYESGSIRSEETLDAALWRMVPEIYFGDDGVGWLNSVPSSSQSYIIQESQRIPSGISNFYGPDIIRRLQDVSESINSGKTLQNAVSRSASNLAELSPNNGADVDAYSNYRPSMLGDAAASRHTNKPLPGHGVDSNAGESRTTELLEASAGGHTGIVQLLVDNGADVNAHGRLGNTALAQAASHGHDAVVKLLLGRGADINARGRFGTTALGAASSGGHRDIVQLLLDSGVDDGKNGDTALTRAASRGHGAVVKLLLERGADINAHGKSGLTALIEASGGGHTGIVQLLLDNGADVNAHGRDRSTALIQAASHGHDIVVKLLLGRGADVNAHGKFRTTALFGYTQDEEGETAIQAALRGGHEAVVKMLFEAAREDLKVNKTSNHGQGPDVREQESQQEPDVPPIPRPLETEFIPPKNEGIQRNLLPVPLSLEIEFIPVRQNGGTRRDVPPVPLSLEIEFIPDRQKEGVSHELPPVPLGMDVTFNGDHSGK